MAFSIYEIDGYQDIAKPSDLIEQPNYYLQDVFNQNRPEVVDVNKSPGETNPYYQFYREDEKEKQMEKSDFRYRHNPSNWSNQGPNLVKKRSDDIKKVISEYRLMANPITYSLEVDNFTSRNAANFDYLLRATSEFSRKNSPRNNVRLLKADHKKGFYTYKVRSYMKESDPKGHIVSVQLDKNTKETDIRQMDIKVSCSCPFWKYWGPDYNAGALNFLQGDHRSDNSKPDVRDKDRKNKICKHVYSVGEIIEKFAKEHDLDTQGDVDDIIDGIEKVDIEEIEKLIEKLDRSEKQELEGLLRKYYQEKDEKKQEKIREKMIDLIEKYLGNKEKSFLRRLYEKVKTFVKEKVFKKSSVSRVLDLYLDEN